MIARMSRAACGRWAAAAAGGRRGGFSLIELLVVIAVIALLISIGAPAVSAARRVSQRAVCGTNLHSIGQAVQSYLNVNRERYPVVANWPPKEPIWAAQERRAEYPAIYRALHKELGAAPAITRHELFKCPSDRNVSGDPDLTKKTYWDETGTSYEWNPLLSGKRLGIDDLLTVKRSLGGIGWTASQIGIVYDFQPFHHKDKARKGSIMYLYADFHVAPDNTDLQAAYLQQYKDSLVGG